MKKLVFIASCGICLLCSRNAVAGTVTVGTLRADEVRTSQLSLPPAAATDAFLYYAFEEDAGSTVMDSSVNGYDGALSGCVWTNTGRYVGGAMSFDGYDDSIRASEAPNFPTWDVYSVSLWFLHDGGGYTGPQYGHKILDKTSYYHDWFISLYPVGATGGTGAIGMSANEDGKFRAMNDDSHNYMDNQWHHLVVVRDGVNGEFWIDGVMKSSCTNMISITSTSDLCVGNSFSDDGYQCVSWSGMLDEVQIYDRALTTNEVADLYEEGALQLAAAPASISVMTNMVVNGSLTVTGGVSFVGGIRYTRPLGDLSSGIYTNAP